MSLGWSSYYIAYWCNLDDDLILSQSKEWHDQVYEIFNDAEIDLWLNEWRVMPCIWLVMEYSDSWKLKGVEEVASVESIKS